MNDDGGGDTGGDGAADGVFVNDSVVNIPDDQESTVATTVDVSGLGGTITDVNVTLNITHTWNEDLQVTLISPWTPSITEENTAYM